MTGIELAVAIIGLLGSLLAAGMAIWKVVSDKKRAEAERRAKEDADAQKKREESQAKESSDAAAHDAQDAAAEEWRKNHQG